MPVRRSLPFGIGGGSAGSAVRSPRTRTWLSSTSTDAAAPRTSSIERLPARIELYDEAYRHEAPVPIDVWYRWDDDEPAVWTVAGAAPRVAYIAAGQGDGCGRTPAFVRCSRRWSPRSRGRLHEAGYRRVRLPRTTSIASTRVFARSSTPHGFGVPSRAWRRAPHGSSRRCRGAYANRRHRGSCTRPTPAHSWSRPPAGRPDCGRCRL